MPSPSFCVCLPHIFAPQLSSQVHCRDPPSCLHPFPSSACLSIPLFPLFHSMMNEFSLDPFTGNWMLLFMMLQYWTIWPGRTKVVRWGQTRVLLLTRFNLSLFFFSKIWTLSSFQGDDHRLGEGFCHHRLRYRPAQKLTLETSSWPGPAAAGGRW